MLVFCTGIAGVQKRQKIEELRRYAEERGRRVRAVHLGAYMLQIAHEIGRPVQPGMILDRVHQDLPALVAAAMERILAELEQEPADVCTLLNIHACFRHNQTLTHGFHPTWVRKIKERMDQLGRPVRFFNLMDSLPRIFRNLRSDAAREEQEQGAPSWKAELTALDVLVWRDEERHISEVFAAYEGCQHYILPYDEPIETFYRLVFEPERQKVYLSFPITGIITRQPSLLEDVRRFAGELRQDFVVFDPLAIKDSEWLRGNLTEEDWPQPGDAEREHVEAQTVARDLQLIDQSDFTVVYNRLDDPVWSDGVVTEMNHTRFSGKPLYIVHLASPGPFLYALATEIYTSTEDLLRDLRARVREPAAGER